MQRLSSSVFRVSARAIVSRPACVVSSSSEKERASCTNRMPAQARLGEKRPDDMELMRCAESDLLVVLPPGRLSRRDVLGRLRSGAELSSRRERASVAGPSRAATKQRASIGDRGSDARLTRAGRGRVEWDEPCAPRNPLRPTNAPSRTDRHNDRRKERTTLKRRSEI